MASGSTWRTTALTASAIERSRTHQPHTRRRLRAVGAGQDGDIVTHVDEHRDELASDDAGGSCNQHIHCSLLVFVVWCL